MKRPEPCPHVHVLESVGVPHSVRVYHGEQESRVEPSHERSACGWPEPEGRDVSERTNPHVYVKGAGRAARLVRVRNYFMVVLVAKKLKAAFSSDHPPPTSPYTNTSAVTDD